MSTPTTVITFYRVVDLPDAGPDSPTGPNWAVQARTAKVTPRRILLARAFTGLGGVSYNETAIGRLFFVSPAEAVRDFAIKQRRNGESYRRQAEAADEALAWAELNAERISAEEPK